MNLKSASLRKTTLGLALVAGIFSLAAYAGVSAVDSPAAAAATPATTVNPYSPAHNHPYRHGVIPTRDVQAAMKRWEAAHPSPQAGSKTLKYGGGVGGVGVMAGQNKVYLVFYGSQWGKQTTDGDGNMKFSHDTAGAAGAAQQMFKGIGTNGETWQNELTQWCNGAATGATSCKAGLTRVERQANILAGVWYDNSKASPASATGKQLAQEAIAAAAHFGNTAIGSNRSTYYVILSPKGTNPDGYQGQYCAWHDYTGDNYGVTAPGGDLAFSNQPYNLDSGSGCGVGFVNTPGTLDGWTMTLGHEWQEMMSDQFPAGGWTASSGQENSDECAWIAAGSNGGAANIHFSTGTFTEQASWSNDTNSCAIAHADVSGGGSGSNLPPTANFSYTTTGLKASFTDSSTDSDGTIASRAWTFGDGATSTLKKPVHTYVAAGTYTVIETVTDNDGAAAAKTSSVTVGVGNNLQNGVPVTVALVLNKQFSSNYKLDVPAGMGSVTISVSGGTGDVDLYVRHGIAPTKVDYSCRSATPGNNEICTFSNAKPGLFNVKLLANKRTEGVQLVGTYSP